MPLSVLTAGEVMFALDEIAGICATLGHGLARPETEAVGEAVVVSGPGAIEHAAEAWAELERADGLANPFQAFVIARAAARVHEARGESIHIALVRDGRGPLAILPLTVSRWSGISTARFIGDPLIQYGDVVASPRATTAHIAAAWRKFVALGVADFVHLRKVRADAAIAPFVAHDLQVVQEDEAPYVALDTSSSVNPRDARELRRFRRRLADCGATAFDVVRGESAVPLLREAMAIKRDWLSSRGLASRVLGDPQWELALLSLARSNGGDRLAAARLTVNGATAALEIGLIHRERWFAFLGATAPQFAKAGPGQVQMAETMAYCRSNGIAVYDLLAPAQPYKRALATGAISVRDYAMPLNQKGRVALCAVRLTPRVRDLVAKLPLGMRRLLLGQRSKEATPGKS